MIAGGKDMAVSEYGKVSIIVPVYNVELYLEDCVKSLTGQTYSDIEILLVDDGSTDGCGAIADRLSENDDRIRVFHKENGGLSSARNLGLEHATGDYLAFIDSDDYAAPNYVEKLIRRMTDENADMVLCNFYISLRDRNVVSERLTHYPDGTVFTPEEYLDRFYTYCGSFAVAWNKLYRRELFDGLEYVPGIQGEDAQILLSLADRCRKIVYLNEELVYYRQRKSSIMGGKKEKWLLSDMDWLEEHMARLEKDGRKHTLSMARKLYISKIEKSIMYCGHETRKKIKAKLRKAMKEFLRDPEFGIAVKLKSLAGYVFPYAFGKYYEGTAYDSDEIWP